MDQQCCVCGIPTEAPLTRITVTSGFYRRSFSNYLCAHDYSIIGVMLSEMRKPKTGFKHLVQLRMDAPLGA